MNKNVPFTGAVLVVGLVYLATAIQMPRGSIAYPGPGFYPSVVGVFLVLTAAVCFGIALWDARKERSATAPTVAEPENTKRIGTPTLQLLALLVFYAGSLPYIGFLLSISVFLLLSMRIFGYQNWTRSIVVTVLIAGASYMVFVHWLSVPLPRGFLGDYL
jgi:putative tricarboxylic transport membrane protein